MSVSTLNHLPPTNGILHPNSPLDTSNTRTDPLLDFSSTRLLPDTAQDVSAPAPPADPTQQEQRDAILSHTQQVPASGVAADLTQAAIDAIALADIVMHDALPDVKPALTNGVTVNGNGVHYPQTNGTTRSAPDTPGDDDGDQPPPAKRARKLSNPEQASLAHTNGIVSSTPTSDALSGPLLDLAPANGTSTPVATTNGDAPEPPADVPFTLSPAQWKFATSIVKNLKKVKDAVPFLNPVDPIALGIPLYAKIITSPMDLATIERKLGASNPTKPNPDSTIPKYRNVVEFVADFRLMIQNCVTFNGLEHVVTLAGKRIEVIFDKQMKQMPPDEEVKPPVPRVVPPPPKKLTPPPKPVAKKPPPAAARRVSGASATAPHPPPPEPIARPKREIHPPAPRDLPYADQPKKRTKRGKKDDGTVNQLKFCGKLLTDLQKGRYWSISAPFAEPVDPVKLGIPTYFSVIKHPMDMSTMKRKLDNGEYKDASKFRADFKLMVNNCLTFNEHGPVRQAGIELQKLFDEKWMHLPPLREPMSEDDDDDSDSEEEDNDAAISMIESQIETMKSNLAALKRSKPKKDKNTKKIAKQASKVGSSKPSKKNKKNSKFVDDEVLSFDQKKELSETIQTLDGTKLERVIQIIHEGVPEIRDSTEEIELDIDSLPPIVLTKLYNFVLRPARPVKGGRGRNSGGGVGGVKRKSMDEEEQAEKIRQLEDRIKLFETNGPRGDSSGTALGLSGMGGNESNSSDSSDSDSSGSDSE